MDNYGMDSIRNVVIMGHGKAGKTSLTEAMLYNSGAIDRLGLVSEGASACDYDAEEIKRKISINAAIAPVEWKGMKYNIIDTPGFFDFVGEVKEGLRAADSALRRQEREAGRQAALSLAPLHHLHPAAGGQPEACHDAPPHHGHRSAAV